MTKTILAALIMVFVFTGCGLAASQDNGPGLDASEITQDDASCQEEQVDLATEAEAAPSPETEAAGPPEDASVPDGSEGSEGDNIDEAEAVFDNDLLPDGFSYLKAENPGIRVDLRFATTNNFTGFVVPGYHSTQAAIMRSDAAAALSDVQDCLENEGLGLLVCEAYRPAKASLFFVEWAKTDDDRMRDEFYPELEKSSLHSLGYIAEKSIHSCGYSVDLTLVDFSTGEEIDMGSSIDLFGDISSHGTGLITAEQTENRNKLKNTMGQFGFSPYSKEWWHYTYSYGKYPNEFFDFDVE